MAVVRLVVVQTQHPPMHGLQTLRGAARSRSSGISAGGYFVRGRSGRAAGLTLLRGGRGVGTAAGRPPPPARAAAP